MHYRAVIFDLLGTLVPRWDSQDTADLRAAMAADLGIPASDFIRAWNETRRDRDTGMLPSVEDGLVRACQLTGTSVEIGRIAMATQRYAQFARESLRPRSEAIPTLQRLRATSYRSGLISNCGPPIPDAWSDTPLAECTDVATFSCSVGLQKPDARIYIHTCQQLGVQPTECLYVGDGGSGELNGATNLGMGAVLIQDPSENLRASARIEVNDWSGPRVTRLDEIPRFLS